LHELKSKTSAIAPGASALDRLGSSAKSKITEDISRSTIFQLNRTLGKIARAALERSRQRVYQLGFITEFDPACEANFSRANELGIHVRNCCSSPSASVVAFGKDRSRPGRGPKKLIGRGIGSRVHRLERMKKSLSTSVDNIVY